MVHIDYNKGLEQEKIAAATFSFEDEKSMILACGNVYGDENDDDRVTGHMVKMLIRDENYGEEELFVEFDLETGKDILKVMQKILRQIGTAKL